MGMIGAFPLSGTCCGFGTRVIDGGSLIFGVDDVGIGAVGVDDGWTGSVGVDDAVAIDNCSCASVCSSLSNFSTMPLLLFDSNNVTRLRRSVITASGVC